MKMKNLFLGLAGATALIVTGCTEVDRADVQAARERVQEEERETAETAREVAQNVREEAKETGEAVEHIVRKPVDTDEVREERKETAEAAREGAEAIAEEKKETREARAEFEETKAKFNAKQNRDAYVAKMEAQLKTAAERIEALEEKADDQEGDAKEITEKQIEVLQASHDRLEEQIEEMKGAELLKWETHRDDVQRASDDLKAKLTK